MRTARSPAWAQRNGTIVSVAHLDDDERALVLGVLLEEILSWVRTLPGSQRLRALIVFDEVYGFLPPRPQNPPTKRPLAALMKQARAFGVGGLVGARRARQAGDAAGDAALAMSYLKGPMTRTEIRRALGERVWEMGGAQ